MEETLRVDYCPRGGFAVTPNNTMSVDSEVDRLAVQRVWQQQLDVTDRANTQDEDSQAETARFVCSKSVRRLFVRFFSE
jgi:uncharacterized protein YoxC